MRSAAIITGIFAMTAIQVGARADVTAAVLSRGARFDVKKALKPEGTTVILFLQDTSAMEQQFLADLEKQVPSDPKVALDVVRLKDVSAPAALQYSVTATPTAIVYDRFGHEIARSSQPDDIKAAVRKGQLMGRIKWIDEDDPKAPEVYGAPATALKRGIPGIIKTMSLRPEAVQMMNLISKIHFTNGFLKRREHEMIAAYVSALNRCKF
jgi:hypothetical protein